MALQWGPNLMNSSPSVLLSCPVPAESQPSGGDGSCRLGMEKLGWKIYYDLIIAMYIKSPIKLLFSRLFYSAQVLFMR